MVGYCAGSNSDFRSRTGIELNMDDEDVDTVAGILMSVSGKMPEEGDRIQFDGAVAEILEVKNDHAEKIRFTLEDQAASE